MNIEQIITKVFFTYAWAKRKKICECGCGEKLPQEISTTCMDHTLEKSVFPDCKWSISNIGYYTPNCHTKKGNGFPTVAQLNKITVAKLNYDNLCKESRNFENTIKRKLKYGEITK